MRPSDHARGTWGEQLGPSALQMHGPKRIYRNRLTMLRYGRVAYPRSSSSRSHCRPADIRSCAVRKRTIVSGLRCIKSPLHENQTLGVWFGRESSRTNASAGASWSTHQFRSCECYTDVRPSSLAPCFSTSSPAAEPLGNSE